MNRLILVAFAALAAAPLRAETVADLSEGARDYVEGNILGTLYHELGHALIDVLEPVVLGQEEDAADVLAVVLAHDLWEEEDARRVASATALSFWLSSEEGYETAYWDVHGPDEQRYYNTVCLFYGADPDARADFAQEFELPEDRAAYCADEFALANESWGAYLDDIALGETEAPAKSLSFVNAGGDEEIAALLMDEVTDLNALYRLPTPVAVRLEACDEANAFYDPETRVISICTEYVDYLMDQAISAEL